MSNPPITVNGIPTPYYFCTFNDNDELSRIYFTDGIPDYMKFVIPIESATPLSISAGDASPRLYRVVGVHPLDLIHTRKIFSVELLPENHFSSPEKGNTHE